MGGGAGELQKEYSRKGQLNEKNSCTPITPKNIRARAYGYNTKITENAAKIKIL